MPLPKSGSDIEVDDSPCTREFERRLITHSEDFLEELGGCKQVQVDLGRAEGVRWVYNKWLQVVCVGGGLWKSSQAWEICFLLSPKKDVSSRSSYQSDHMEGQMERGRKA